MEINNNSTINYKEIFQTAISIKFILIAIIVICTIVSIIVAFMMPKIYQSTTLVQIKTTPPTPITTLGAAVGVDISDNNSNDNSPETYIELMQSKEVIQPIIDQIDISDEEKAKMNDKEKQEN